MDMRGLLWLACSGLTASAGLASDMLEVSPISLFGSSYGCAACCNGESCRSAFQDTTPGTCCTNRGNPQCCPTMYNGQAYHCQATGPGTFGCAPGAGGGYQQSPAPPPYYQPPAPRYQPPAPPPPPRYHYSAPAPAPKPEICNKQTGGTCSYMSCSASRGQTNCVGSMFSGHKCVCQDGYCAFNGKCIKKHGCNKATPGSCRILGCSSKRGEVDCVSGQCVCKPGACAVNGVCTNACEKATGASCHILGCKSSRKAECQSGACVCGKKDCNWQGSCLSGSDAEEMWMSLATNVTSKKAALSDLPEKYIGSFPDMVNTYVGKLDAAICGCLTGSMVFSFVWRRRTAAAISTEPLLGTEA